MRLDEGSIGDALVNVGCGATPTPGWINFDNSMTVRLVRFPLLCTLLGRAGLLAPHQLEFARVARDSGIFWANVSRSIPLPDNSARAIYSSHMLEHLDLIDAGRFLAEARRVLRDNGVLRIAVPDLLRMAKHYVEGKAQADEFLKSSLLGRERPRGLWGTIRQLGVGDRSHLWMYDAASLAALLRERGFLDPREMPAGKTGIPDPGALDLREREEESIYVEARKAP